VEKTGERRPWKSQERFPLSHSSNNNKLDDRDHFQQTAKTSVASLRRLITPTRNADHDQPGTLITFIGIRTDSPIVGNRGSYHHGTPEQGIASANDEGREIFPFFAASVSATRSRPVGT